MAAHASLGRYFLPILFYLVLLPHILIAQPLDNWHWRNPLPQGNPLNGITYGNNTFVSVGRGGTIITSTDGVAWEKRTSGTHYNLCGVAYGNGTFIAVGEDFDGVTNKYSGIILASPDAITWTTKLLGYPNSLRAVTYGYGTFVVAGQTGSILTSADGETWVTIPSSTEDWLYGITSGNGTFVAVGKAGTILTYGSSTWNAEVIETSNSLLGIGYGGNSFVAVGGSGTILTSLNGETWDPKTSGTTRTLTGVAYGGNTFIVVEADSFFTSPDGDIWTRHDTPTRGNFPVSVSFGNSTFVAVGFGGAILTSPDGADWIIRSGAGDNLDGIAYGNGKFVAVGGHAILLSSDGLSWTKKDIFVPGSDDLVDLRYVTFANGIFVAVGGHEQGFGIIATSSDGEEWSIKDRLPTPDPDLDGLNCVAYGNNTFVAVGGSTILTSTDGEIWLPSPSHGMVSFGLLRGVVYGKGIFVAVGGTQSQSRIFTSPDGIQWSIASISGRELFGVAFGNNLFIAVGNYTITTSSNGMDWTTNASSYQFSAIGYGNGYFVATGSGGRILTSLAGVEWVERHSECTNLLWGVAFVDDTFFVVGEYGSILQSDPLSTVGLFPEEGTIGTEIIITGSGFGIKKGKVLIGGVAPKLAKDGWADDRIVCLLTKVPPPGGPYDVTIIPYRSTSSLILPGAFTVKIPEIDSLDMDRGQPLTPITVSGRFSSTKKGKVYIEDTDSGKKKTCKVTSWSMNPANGKSTLTFIVPKLPKPLPPGTYTLKIINKLGITERLFTVDSLP